MENLRSDTPWSENVEFKKSFLRCTHNIFLELIHTTWLLELYLWRTSCMSFIWNGGFAQKTLRKTKNLPSHCSKNTFKDSMDSLCNNIVNKKYAKEGGRLTSPFLHIFCILLLGWSKVRAWKEFEQIRKWMGRHGCPPFWRVCETCA